MVANKSSASTPVVGPSLQARDAVDRLPSVLLRLDREGKILWLSEGLFSRPKEEQRGLRLSKLFTGRHREAVARVLSEPERWLGCLEDDLSDTLPLWPREDWASDDGEYAAWD